MKGGEKLNKQTLGIIGLVGGIIAMVSVALAWVTVSMTVGGRTESGGALGIDFLKAGGEGTGMGALVLVGGILALLGAIGLLIAKRPLGYLLPVGGILALAGGIWCVARCAQLSGVIAQAIQAMGGTVSFDLGYGIYVGIVGAVLALVGSLGLKGK